MNIGQVKVTCSITPPENNFRFSPQASGPSSQIAKSKSVITKGFFSQSTKRCGIVVESDSIPLEGSRLHRFAQKIGTVNFVEIVLSL